MAFTGTDRTAITEYPTQNPRQPLARQISRTTLRYGVTLSVPKGTA